MTATGKFTARTKPYDYRLKVNRPWPRSLTVTVSQYGNYTCGLVVTVLGCVEVYFQEGDSSFTALSFSYRGYFYSRQWRKTFSRRCLVTLADRFARDCAKGGA